MLLSMYVTLNLATKGSLEKIDLARTKVVKQFPHQVNKQKNNSCFVVLKCKCNHCYLYATKVTMGITSCKI